jgi:hypothetical protein
MNFSPGGRLGPDEIVSPLSGGPCPTSGELVPVFAPAGRTQPNVMKDRRFVVLRRALTQPATSLNIVTN